MPLLRTAILFHLRLSLKEVSHFRLSIQAPSRRRKLLHSHLWLHGSRVERRLVLDKLVDRLCGVDDAGLDYFALNDRLNRLMHVVVNMLASDGARRGGFILRC